MYHLVKFQNPTQPPATSPPINPHATSPPIDLPAPTTEPIIPNQPPAPDNKSTITDPPIISKPTIKEKPIIINQPPQIENAHIDNSINYVNIDEIPINSKISSFEELLQKELDKNNGKAEMPVDNRTSFAHLEEKRKQREII